MRASLCFLLLFVGGLTAVDEIDPKWLEHIMIKEGTRRGIGVDKLTSLQLIEVDPPGLNTGSNRTRAEMKLKLKSGQTIEKSVVIIDFPSDPIREKQISESGMFEVDINVYEHVLPQMDELLKRTKSHDSLKLWVKSYALEKYKRLVIEDVKSLQHVRPDKFEGLNMDECKLAMRYLAEFHALSAVLESQHLIPSKPFDLSLGERNREQIGDWFGTLLIDFAKSIRAAWGSDWEDTADFFDEEAKTITQKRLDIFKRDDSKLNVLNIGYFYINNVYFRYKVKGSKKIPVSLKSINFQTAFRNSPAIDLQVFINTTPQSNIIINDRLRYEIICEYADALVNYLKAFGYDKPITQEYVHSEMRRTELLGLTYAINNLGGIYSKPEDAAYTEKFIIEALKSKKIKIDSRGMVLPKFIDVMKHLVTRAQKLGVIQTKLGRI